MEKLHIQWDLMRPVLALSILWSACSDPAGQDLTPAVTEADSSGVRIVTTEYAAHTDVLGQQVASQPDVSIGARAGDSAGVDLHEVSDARWLSDGRIIVLNGGGAEVLIFAPSGELEIAMGGRGEGPGEFHRLSGIVEVGHDSVVVYDSRLGRLTFLGTDGSVLETTTIEPLEDALPWAYRLAGALGDSAFVMVAQAFAPRMRNPAERYEHRTPHLIYNHKGQVVDSIGGGLRVDAFGSPNSAGLVAYGRFSSADVHDGYLYQADGRPYEIRIHDSAGLQKIFRLHRPQREPSATEEQAHLEYLLERTEDPVQRGRARESYEDTPRAQTKPWIRRVRIGRDGRVWVMQWEPYWVQSETARWGMFGVGGRYLGSLDLPAQFRLTDADERRILGIWTDELDVQHVREYRLVDSLD